MNQLSITPCDHLTPPDDEWAAKVCKIGQGAACCRYLTFCKTGWSCEKFGVHRRTLDARVETGSMGSRGDNCDGRAAR